jgi:hypothetical protein
MKKFKLLLLDTNIVIKAFEIGLWQKLTERCEIWLAGTVRCFRYPVLLELT